jgi:hypothetical protein
MFCIPDFVTTVKLNQQRKWRAGWHDAEAEFHA